MIYSRSIVCRVLLAFTTCFFQLSQVQAQEETVAVAFHLPDEILPDSLNIPECDFREVAVSGRDFIYSCSLRRVYQLTYQPKDPSGQKNTAFGVLQLRPGALPSTFDALPLHSVLQYGESLAEGFLLFDALPDDQYPLRELPDQLDLVDLPDVVLADTSSAVVDVNNLTGEPPVSVQVSWSERYGMLNVDGYNIRDLRQDDGRFSGFLDFKSYDHLSNEPATLHFSAQRNPECKTVVEVDSTTTVAQDTSLLIELPCSEYLVELSGGFTVSGASCRQLGLGSYACLLRPEDIVTLDQPGWTSIQLVAAELKNAQSYLQSALSEIRPVLDTQALRKVLQTQNNTGCAPRNLDVRMHAVCLQDNCQPVDVHQGLLENDAFLSLGAMAWSADMLPSAVELELIAVNRASSDVLKTARIEIGPDFQNSVERFATSSDGIATYPVSLDLAPGIFQVGRTLQFYSDASCTDPMLGKLWDLSNPGNTVPNVGQCSYYRLLDSGRPRSSCLVGNFDTAKQVVRVAPDMDECASKKIVVLIVEDRTLNGIEGQRILEAITAYAETMRNSEACLPVDLARSVEEERTIILSSEDAYFMRSDTEVPERITMHFVNRASETLRDFEWAYRQWGEQLGGLIVIGDGTRVRATDMIDSPASMAWELKGVPTHFLDISGRNVCDLFEKTLKFDSCIQSTAATFFTDFNKTIASGLKALGDGN